MNSPARGTATITVAAPPAETVSDFALTQALDIHGTVVDATTGDPVADAMVWLKSADAPEDDPGQADLSDESGLYQIANVAAGDYAVYCQADGYVWAAQPSVTVFSPGLELSWQLQSIGARIHGQLTEVVSGLPVGRQMIVLSGSDLVLTTLTDASGHYIFDTVPLGTWNIRASGEADESAPTVVVQLLIDNITQNLTFNFDNRGTGALTGSARQGANRVKHFAETFTALRIVDWTIGTASDRQCCEPSGLNDYPLLPWSPSLATAGRAVSSSDFQLQEPPWPSKPESPHFTCLQGWFNGLWEDMSTLLKTHDTLVGILTYIEVGQQELDGIEVDLAKEEKKFLDAIWKFFAPDDLLTCLKDSIGLLLDPNADMGELLESLISCFGPGSLIVAGKHQQEVYRLDQERFHLQIELEDKRRDYESRVEQYQYDLWLYEERLAQYRAANQTWNEDCGWVPVPKTPTEPTMCTLFNRVNRYGVQHTPFTSSTQSTGCASTDVIGPIDPNEKVGPTGSGEQRVVGVNDALQYVVYFENLAAATAPAQEVAIVDYLDSDLDWMTFLPVEIAFGDTVVPMSDGIYDFYTRQIVNDYRADVDKEWWVDITVEINPLTGRVQWTLRTLDPETGELPEDPLAGFLPPNDETGRGEGHVVFSVKPRSDLPNGTVISNQASIVFDTEISILTNEVWNTIGGPSFSVYLPVILQDFP